MTIRPASGQQHPLYDVTATRALEQAALAHGAAHALMERAGAATARLAAALAPNARHVWIACGQGNNGGDGLAAAVQLHRAGRPVSVSFGGDPDRLPSDARWAFASAVSEGVAFGNGPPAALTPQDICIDALLGIGIGNSPRAMPPWMLAALAALQQAPCPVLAIDVPSGLDASTGQYADGFPNASTPRTGRHTLSLLTLKPGLFTGRGRDAAGTIWFDDLGIDASWFEQATPTAWLSARPDVLLRSHASHKGSFGDVAVLGGEGLSRRGMGMTGAALLAGSAALHAGAGRVLVALLDGSAAREVDTSQPELMIRTPATLDLRGSAVVCGCGGGEAIREYLSRVLEESGRLVLDADALNGISADHGLQEQLRARSSRGAITVLTPHPREAARLLQTGTATVQANRLHAAQQMSERFECVVVLKGSGTVIAAPGATPAINPTGNGRLATAGTGDVLAGMMGARLAAAAPAEPMTIRAAFDAARDTVYRHGAIADRWPCHWPLTASGLAGRWPVDSD